MDTPEPLKGMDKRKKTMVYAAAGGIGLFVVYALVKSRKSNTTAASGQDLTGSVTGQIPVFGGSAGGGETLFLPGQTGGAGASQVSGSPVTTPQPSLASQLGFTNANTPVSLVGGSLIDTGTGRVAYYGPNGQPGSASNFSGATSWVDPTGKTVFYNPNSYQYADTTRAPDIPPVHALAG